MNTLLMQSLFCHVAGLINLLWLHGLKTRREQQKEPNYLKHKLLSKSFNYFWNACREVLEKKLNIESSLPEVFLTLWILEEGGRGGPVDFCHYVFLVFSYWLNFCRQWHLCKFLILGDLSTHLFFLIFLCLFS